MRNVDQHETVDWVFYPTVGANYSHYKGGIYKIIAIGKDHNDEKIVIYQSEMFNSFHTRPLSQWFDYVTSTKDGKEVSVVRFRKI